MRGKWHTLSASEMKGDEHGSARELDGWIPLPGGHGLAEMEGTMKPFQNIDHLMRWYVHHHLTATDVHYPSCTPHPDHIVVDRTPMNDHDVHIADQAYTWRLIDIEVRAWIINHTRRDYETVRKLLCLTWEMARKEPEGAGYKNRNQYDKARSGLYERLSGHLMYQPNLVPLMVDPDERDLQYRRAG